MLSRRPVARFLVYGIVLLTVPECRTAAALGQDESVQAAHRGKRKWQQGTLTDVGLRRRTFAAGSTASRQPFGSDILAPAEVPQVATYIIETASSRFELEETVAIAGADPIELTIAVGESIVFAIERGSFYIRNKDGTERRLKLTKQTPRKR